MSEFERHLRYGQQGERVVAPWLGRRGYFVTPTASIIDPRYRAPSLVNEYSGGRKVLPDFLASLGGRSRWVEVKTKSRDVYFQKTREHRQGIATRLFDDYLFVEKETGIEGFLAFLVAGPPPPKLRIGSLAMLDQHRRTGVMDGVPHVFWPIDLFETHQIVDDDLILICPAPQPAKVSYPWERPAPPTNDQQEYFKFGEEGAA